MMASHENTRTNKQAIIGMGKTGQAVAHFLRHRGLACEGFDEAAVSMPDALAGSQGLRLHIGALNADTLKTFSRVIVSPGINWHHPVLDEVRQAGVPVVGDLSLFSESYHGDVIAITGTNGKTTTVTLIDTMLDVLNGGIEAGGNIGTPMLDLIGDINAPEVEPLRVVLELSSFQLERVG